MPRIVVTMVVLLFVCNASTQAQTQPVTTLPFTLGRDTTIIKSPLLKSGAPDYISALNEKYNHT